MASTSQQRRLSAVRTPASSTQALHRPVLAVLGAGACLAAPVIPPSQAAERETIEPGKLADLVVVAENPLANFKVLYGTGAVRVTADNEVVRTGGVRCTIKDGIVFDAERLRSDVRDIVRRSKADTDYEILQPAVETRHGMEQDLAVPAMPEETPRP